VTATVLGALLTAGALGVTHAIEPDHVAGISSLTSRYGDSRLSAFVGACFSLGHVVLVVAWLALGYVLLGQTDFSAAFDTFGTLGVAVLLGLLGATMTVGGLRSILYAHDHDHGDDARTHLHLRVPGLGAPGHDPGTGGGQTERDHDHRHGRGQYLKVGLVGALFTLSPPTSMIVFSATLFPAYGPDVVVGAVAAYAVAITASMSALGAGVGMLFGAVEPTPRVHGGARLVAGLAVAGLAASLFVTAVPALV
jgi:hypothetical protein